MKILVTGGGGYVGSSLVPELLKQGHSVIVYDLFIYGSDVLDVHPNLKLVKADIRNREAFAMALLGVDAVVHLACISNDPSFELNPSLGRSINLDPFEDMVRVSKELGVKRFIYASSSSVYGVKDEENVTEDMLLEPLTDYSKFKAECEIILSKFKDTNFTVVTLRPATVCGYSRRQRLDVIVNIFTNHAVCNKKIKIFGGDQKRPNIHIADMVRAYQVVLDAPKELVNGKIYNVGYQNYKVNELAQMVMHGVGEDVECEVVATEDNRSYHVSSEKILRELGFSPKFTIQDAIKDLVVAFESGLLKDSMNNSDYYNIKKMQELRLS